MRAEQVYRKISEQCRTEFVPLAVASPQRLAELYLQCEDLLDTYHPERADRLACEAGCGACCIVNVAVLWPEVVAILEHLEADGVDLRQLEGRLDMIWTRIRGVDDEDRVCMRQPCVFLDKQGGCAIYPVRPLLCRSITSTDAASCRESFNANLYNESRAVEMNLFQKELYDAAYLGLSRGLEEEGLDGRGFELTGLLRHLLKNDLNRHQLVQGVRLSWADLA